MRSWQHRPQQQTQLSPSILSLVSTRPRTPGSKHHALLFRLSQYSSSRGTSSNVYSFSGSCYDLPIPSLSKNHSIPEWPAWPGKSHTVERITRLIWIQSTLLPTENHVWDMDSRSWLASEALTDLNLGSYLMAGNTGFLTHTMERWRSSSLHKVIRTHKCNNWKAQFRTNSLFILVP